MSRFCTAAAWGAVLAACSQAGAGPVFDPLSRHSYRAAAVPGSPLISWEDAGAAAQARSGHPATTQSQAESKSVDGLIGRAWNATEDRRLEYRPDYQGDPAADPWIGGEELPGGGETGEGWSWVTGQGFTYAAPTPTRASAGYDAQPGDSGGPGTGQEQHVDFFSPSDPDAPYGGLAPYWNAGTATFQQKGYAVEWEDDPGLIPEPGALAVWGLLAMTGFLVGWWRRGKRKALARSVDASDAGEAWSDGSRAAIMEMIHRGRAE